MKTYQVFRVGDRTTPRAIVEVDGARPDAVAERKAELMAKALGPKFEVVVVEH